MLNEKYDKAKEERKKHVDAVLNSQSKKKIVVAGPGTGKTTLFSKVLEKAGIDSLTLTFINALVDDLSLGLYGLSDVKTLHSFAATFMKKKTGSRVHPRLSVVIKEDAKILIGEDIDFDKIFQEGSGEQESFEFYKKRKDYYGKYYGYCDVIYALVKYLEKFPIKIPVYNQVIVDEFQDFNKTEVRLIDLLATKSPMLIAGDDDQSLYINLKNANPKYIREKHSSLCHEYLPFPLPFCSRSAEVIVDAANDIVNMAKASGLLKNRIDKPYKYFPSEEKDEISLENQKIVYKQIDNDKYFGKLVSYIQREISDIAKKERGKFNILIVIPPQLKKYTLPQIVKVLKKNRFKKVIYPQDSSKETGLLDGLKILLGDAESNLGWRMVSKKLLDTLDFESILKKSYENSSTIKSFLDANFIEGINKRLSVLRKIRDDKIIPKEILREFLEEIDLSADQIVREKIREDLLDEDVIKYDAPRGIRDIPITITTIPSSKGLSGDYVFITNLDDAYYLDKGNLTDNNVFSFLVALTRARKKVFLISSRKKEPTFLKWIEKSRIERI